MRLETTDGKIVEVEVDQSSLVSDRRVSLLVYEETEGGAVTYLTLDEARQVIAGLQEAINSA